MTVHANSQQRGLVPALSYNGHIITESGIVAQFLADAHPSHLLPPSNTVEGALQRSRIAFFVDTFFSKVQGHFMASQRASSDADRAAAGEALVTAIEKELEPILASQKGSGPFFGGSEKLTLAEVLTGSFLLRLLSFHKPEIGWMREDLPELLEKRTPAFTKWAKATVQQESVNFIWDEKSVVEQMRKKLASLAKK
jgi:glutathione S-transferase